MYVLLASLLLASMAAILINSWTTQNNVRSTTDATNRGQVYGAAVERAVRNAVDLRVLPSDTDGTRLEVWTSLGGSLTCQGFELTEGFAAMSRSAGVLPALPDWGSWATDILRHDGEPFFARAGDTVVYTFDVETESASVRFSGEASMRSTRDGEESPCW